MPKTKRDSAPNVPDAVQVALGARHPDVPAAVQQWADERPDSGETRTLGYAVTLQPQWGQPDADGFVPATCYLTGRAFAVLKTMPLVCLSNGTAWPNGEHDERSETHRLSPHLVAQGEDAVREAMRRKAARLLTEASEAIREATSLHHAAGLGLPAAWPSYWVEEAREKLAGVR
jgi:hypothetical protein